MRKEKLTLWKPEEYTYPMAMGFIPNIMTYIHDEDTQIRPVIIVVPGGGYCVVSPTEAEIVALDFYEKGYNAFVLTYTTNLLMQSIRLIPTDRMRQFCLTRSSLQVSIHTRVPSWHFWA